MQVRVLKNKQIDYSRWDEAVYGAHNGLVFAFTWYLDAVCADWHAIVGGDYEALLPLPVYRWWLWSKVKLPDDIPFLEIIGNKQNATKTHADFLKALGASYPVANISLAHAGIAHLGGWASLNREVFKMDLIRPFNKIQLRYHHPLKALLYNARKTGYTALSGLQPSDYMRLIDQADNSRETCLPEKMRLRTLFASALRYHHGELVGVYNPWNTLCGAALFTGSHNKCFMLHTIVSISEERGMITSLIINRYLEDNAGKNITLYLVNQSDSAASLSFEAFGIRPSEYQSFSKKPFLFNYLGL